MEEGRCRAAATAGGGSNCLTVTHTLMHETLALALEFRMLKGRPTMNLCTFCTFSVLIVGGNWSG